MALRRLGICGQRVHTRAGTIEVSRSG